MAFNIGKKFEAEVKKSWNKSFPGSFIYRLQDQMNGYAVTSQNPCDFIGYTKGKLFLIEAKSHKGNTLPFTAIRQYDLLTDYLGLEGVYPIVIGWFIEHDTIFAIHIKDIERMIADGKKSINIKNVKNKEYNIIEIPSIKKRVFFDSDFTALLNL